MPDTLPFPTLDWPGITTALNTDGFAIAPKLLSPNDCAGLRGLYTDDSAFRSTITMARHGFGRGEYRYFRYPLPATVQRLRESLYPPLAAIANTWMERLRDTRRYPASHAAYRDQCHAAGQQRPTPLLLKYGPGDYNCLHQDLYGEEVFPIQVAILLSQPDDDFTGGEFVLTEQRPRRQSKVSVAPLTQGDAVIFAVNQRPVTGTRGIYRATMRHGVSEVRSGDRYTLGVIFHDAT
jgi:hypothetical protein